ncbi:MAG: protein kinase [Phycisphaerales bacterium]|nr:protein kinase [Phycisphaerales bacterium]
MSRHEGSPPPDAAAFGFESGDTWLSQLREAEREQPLGELGGYVLVRELGRGGQGSVYAALQPGTGRTVALKRLAGGAFASPGASSRFEREIRILGSLSHEGIVTVHECLIHEDQPFLVMELVEGIPADLWADGEDGHRRSSRDCSALVGRVADAVAHAHYRGVIHRDLKPSNILVDRADRPHVVDFGVARLSEPGSDPGSLTTRGFVGTPDYAAPEQFGGSPDAVDTRSDVYALGLVLYRMLTGALPWRTPRSFAEAADTTQDRRVVPPSRAGSVNDTDLDTIVLRAIAPSPADRYGSADAFGADLRRWLAGEPIEARPPTAAYMLSRLVRRHPGLSIAVLVAGAGVVTALATISALLARAESARADAVAGELAVTRRETGARLAAAEASLRSHDVLGAGRSLRGVPEALRGWEWRHLATRLDDSEVTLRHNSIVRGAAFDSAARRLITSTRDGVVHVWSWPACEPLAEWKAHPREAIPCPLPGADVLLTAGDGQIIAWSLPGGSQLASTDAHAGLIDAIAVSPSGVLASVGQDRAIRLWDTAPDGTLRPRCERTDLEEIVRSVAWLPNGSGLLVSGATATLWLDPGTLHTRFDLPSYTGEARSIAVSPDARYLAQGGTDRLVHIWDLSTRSELAPLYGHGFAVDAVAFAHNGSSLYSASWDRTIREWSVPAFLPLHLRAGHHLAIDALAIAPDSGRLVTGSVDSTARVWPSEAAADLFDVVGRERIIRCAISSDERTALVTVSGSIRLLDLATGAPPLVLADTPCVREYSAAAISPDDAWAVAGVCEGVVRCWPLSHTTRPLVGSPVDLSPPAPAAQLAPDLMAVAVDISASGMLAVGWSNGALVLWDSIGGAPGFSAVQDGTQVTGVRFSPEGDRLVVTWSDSRITMFDAGTGQTLASTTLPFRAPRAPAFSPSGAEIAVGMHGTSVVLLDADSLAVTRTLSGHSLPVNALVYHPDGSRLASASDDRTIGIWDLEHGELMLSLRAHDYLVSAVMFNRPGTTLWSASADGAVRRWGTDPYGTRAAR